MLYIEIKCTVNPIETGNEIVIALLADMGCDSFVETEDGVLAYIPKDIFEVEQLDALFSGAENWDFTDRKSVV